METICLHQFIRPSYSVNLNDGSGDCGKCTKSEKNKECKMYSPIKISTLDVEGV